MAVPYDQKPNANAEVQRLEDAIALIDNEITLLYQLHVPARLNGISPLAATSFKTFVNSELLGGNRWE